MPALDVPGRRDAGLSLVELLVTMVIAGIILPLIFAVVISAQRQTMSTMKTVDAVAAARLGLQDIDRQVRSGDAPIFVDGRQTLGFATQFDAEGKQLATQFDAKGKKVDPARCIQYKVDNLGDLKTRTFLSSDVPPSWPPASLASNLTNDSAFAVTDPTSPAPSSVRVTLVVAGGASGGAAIQRLETIESVLTVRNTATTTTTAACGVFS